MMLKVRWEGGMETPAFFLLVSCLSFSEGRSSLLVDSLSVLGHCS
jgi:hypothetical protein